MRGVAPCPSLRSKLCGPTDPSAHPTIAALASTPTLARTDTSLRSPFVRSARRWRRRCRRKRRASRSPGSASGCIGPLGSSWRSSFLLPQLPHSHEHTHHVQLRCFPADAERLVHHLDGRATRARFAALLTHQYTAREFSQECHELCRIEYAFSVGRRFPLECTLPMKWQGQSNHGR